MQRQHAHLYDSITTPSNARLTLPIQDSMDMTRLPSNQTLLSHNRSRIRDMFFEYIRFCLSNTDDIGGQMKGGTIQSKVGP